VTEIVCVGTSDAFGAGGRRQSAYLVRTPSGGVLLDCGATTGTGLATLGIAREEIDLILVSHFHADHFGGIPLFLLAVQYLDGRAKPLRIAGPPDVEARVRRAAAALGHPMENHDWSFPILFQELLPGQEVAVGPASVDVFETLHSPDAHPHGLVLRSAERRVVYSGDTGWFDGLPRHANGADLFLCECTLTQQSFEYHLSLEELAERRHLFDCGRWLLTHLGEEMRSLTDHMGFEVADDGLVVKL
jgi:ribonuclease BN (tRNA processing enzyme)